jgi:ankyrin repeat protein
VLCGHTDIIKLILATGKVEVHLRDHYGHVAFIWATRLGYNEIVELPLDSSEVEDDAKNNDKETTTTLVKERGYVDTVGCYIHMRTNFEDALYDQLQR